MKSLHIPLRDLPWGSSYDRLARVDTRMNASNAYSSVINLRRTFKEINAQMVLSMRDFLNISNNT